MSLSLSLSLSLWMIWVLFFAIQEFRAVFFYYCCCLFKFVDLLFSISIFESEKNIPCTIPPCCCFCYGDNNDDNDNDDDGWRFSLARATASVTLCVTLMRAWKYLFFLMGHIIIMTISIIQQQQNISIINMVQWHPYQPNRMIFIHCVIDFDDDWKKNSNQKNKRKIKSEGRKEGCVCIKVEKY